MKVAAVSTVRNEADIIGSTIRHLLAEGIDRIYIADGMSTDGTRDILRALPVVVLNDPKPYHDQPYWIRHLAGIAREDGAEWIVPFDADEFWYSPTGRPLVDVLAEQPPQVDKLHAKTWQHIDYEWCEPEPKKLQKVCFRAVPDVHIDPGNHDCTLTGGGPEDLVAIRELQYRGFDHFQRKILERNATLDPELKGKAGWHHSRYEGWTPDQLAPEWEQAVARATTLDPIPVRRYAPHA